MGCCGRRCPTLFAQNAKKGGPPGEGKIILDKTNGHAAYGCAWCCGLNNVQFTGNPITIPILGIQAQQVEAQNVCNGYWQDVTAAFLGWGTGNTSIATANGSQIKGISAGSTTDFAQGTLVYGHERMYGDECPTHQWTPSGPVNVGPYQIEPIATASQGPANCSIKGQAGWVKNVTNQVQYLNGTAYAVSGLSVSDTITVGTPNGLGVTGKQEGQAPTTGDGSFPDTYYVCSSACPGTGESDATQSWVVGGIHLPHVNGLVYKCTSISIDGH